MNSTWKLVQNLCTGMEDGLWGTLDFLWKSIIRRLWLKVWLSWYWKSFAENLFCGPLGGVGSEGDLQLTWGWLVFVVFVSLQFGMSNWQQIWRRTYEWIYLICLRAQCFLVFRFFLAVVSSQILVALQYVCRYGMLSFFWVAFLEGFQCLFWIW